ncbi:MAG: ATP-binding domain-containing protein [Planctomycetota bacterium]|mgnify:CR=1 FL=1
MKDAWWVNAKELNGEQRDVITLPPDGSHLVTGPPGCGKTNLLVLRANYLTMRAHANILILVFTRTLQEFIRTGAQQYAFPDSSVVTSRSWERSLLKEHGYDPNVQGTFAQQRMELLARMKEMVAVRQLGHIYDAIFLDEAQDYLAGEIELFRRLTPRLFAVADSRQRIYDVDDPIETLKRLTDKYCPLKYHYRCGRKICLAADSLRRGDYTYDPLEETFQYDEEKRPSTVDSDKCSSLDEAAGLVLERLKIQLEAYPDELLGVVAPRREDAECIGQKLLASEIGTSCVVQSDTDYISFGANTSVCVCSLHAAKGLEFRTVHLVGAEGFPAFRDKQKRMAYTAITRAKTSLNLYSVDPLPGYLAQAVYDANPQPDPPDLDAVFRGKR